MDLQTSSPGKRWDHTAHCPRNQLACTSRCTGLCMRFARGKRFQPSSIHHLRLQWLLPQRYTVGSRVAFLTPSSSWGSYSQSRICTTRRWVLPATRLLIRPTALVGHSLSLWLILLLQLLLTAVKALCKSDCDFTITLQSISDSLNDISCKMSLRNQYTIFRIFMLSNRM